MRIRHLLAVALCAAVVLALAASSAHAGRSAREIVDAEYVERAVADGAILWDVRAPEAYAEGHLPGAVNIGLVTSVLRDPITEDWLPKARIERLLGEAGIDLLDNEVIVYGGGGDPAAAFGWLTVRHFGGKSARFYYGGIHEWKASCKPITTKAVERDAVALKLAPEPGVVLATDQVLARLPAVKAGTVQLIDVRTAPEYRGKTVSALRGGHIPGAVNISMLDNWSNPPTPEMVSKLDCDVAGGFKLLPEAGLAKLYAQLDPKKETITYCGSGVRAALTAAILRDLGFEDVKVYEPSWLGYANTLSAPVDDEVFVNIGAINKQIKALEARIEELERLLEARPPAR